ncbi:hypothetical protein J3998_09970 [Thiomicrorhabdus sp. 6S2-11]|uniref:DUF3106 domain-containing protein n=1 Tax=Thiomicrorhabdus marina TaxID=2818442 RepID=A0ABS3Q6G4_9GAMM|nr:hypothetical protein [Thiomicrorhabdus marina]MBO1927902.1 hypothetical protein [Thiomicrorhabdus marina]
MQTFQSTHTNTVRNTLIGLFTGALLLTSGAAVAQEHRTNGVLSIDIELFGGQHREPRQQPAPQKMHRHESRHRYDAHSHKQSQRYQHNPYQERYGKHAKNNRDYRSGKYHRVSPLIVLSQDLFLSPFQDMRLRVILGDHWDGHMNRKEARQVHKMLTPKQRRQWNHLGYYSNVSWRH